MEKPNGESCLAGILTVVVDNVNRVLIFWEADGVASGDGQQRHTSQQQREPHDRQGRGRITSWQSYSPVRQLNNNTTELSLLAGHLLAGQILYCTFHASGDTATNVPRKVPWCFLGRKTAM